MAKILIVDDEPVLLQAMTEGLTPQKHTIVSAENGRIASDILKREHFDLVISDFQMPEMDGVELLKWIKATKPTKVILVTGFSHILETREAFELGADDFLTKPLRLQELIGAVNKALSGDAGKSAASVDSEYCRFPIEDFVSSHTVNVGLYVRLSEAKYVRVAHLGDQLPLERVETYRQRGITFLYCKKQDFAKVVDFNMEMLGRISKSSQIPPEKKASFLRYTSEVVLENCMVKGMNKETFEQAKNCLERALSLITESDQAFTLLTMLNAHADWIYAHSLGVSIYSVMIAKKMGWESATTLFKLSAAGLFHDIGKKEIDTNILTKKRANMEAAERNMFESHPRRGRDILVDLKEMPSDLVQIVYEHHEDGVGQGFPSGISKEKIHPLAKVVAVADMFCAYAIKNPHSAEGMSGPDAIKRMEETGGPSLHPAPFKALSSLQDNPL